MSSMVSILVDKAIDCLKWSGWTRREQEGITFHVVRFEIEGVFSYQYDWEEIFIEVRDRVRKTRPRFVIRLPSLTKTEFINN